MPYHVQPTSHSSTSYLAATTPQCLQTIWWELDAPEIIFSSSNRRCRLCKLYKTRHGHIGKYRVTAKSGNVWITWAAERDYVRSPKRGAECADSSARRFSGVFPRNGFSTGGDLLLSLSQKSSSLLPFNTFRFFWKMVNVWRLLWT